MFSFNRGRGIGLVFTLGLLCSCEVGGLEVEPPGIIKVAACQVFVSGDPAEGMQAIERALSKAASQGADLACFPETSILGWVNPKAHQLADPIPGPTTNRLGNLAGKYGMMIAIGIAERDGDQLFDSAVLIDRDGSILLKHRKVNILSELMDPPYTPGGDARQSVADTRLGRIAMLVCADTFTDEVVDEIKTAKPDLLVVPYGWAAPLEQWPEHGKSLQSWVAHTARRIHAPVVGVDATGEIHHGPWTGFLYGGQSVVCNSDGVVQGVMADRQPEVRVFEIDLAASNPEDDH